jgi:solute carrier family 25 carnitine/acylcarnitine transporter 20/29
MSGQTAVDLFAGVGAGVIAAVAGQPLDTIRVRLQSRPELFHGPIDTLVKTVKWDGVRGLFAGLGPQTVGMCGLQAVNFVSFGVILRGVEARVPSSAAAAAPTTVELWRSTSTQNLFLAGSLVAVPNSLIQAPADRLKCLMQMETKSQTGRYSGAVDCARQVIAADGIRMGLFRGFGLTYVRNTIGGGVYFTSFELIRRQLCGVMGGWESFVAGGCAGMIGWLVPYPLDSIKRYFFLKPRRGYPHYYFSRHYQIAVKISIPACPPMTSGTFSCSVTQSTPPSAPLSNNRWYMVRRQLHAQHGYKWAYRGLGPTLARGFVVNATTLGVYTRIVELVGDASK